MKSPIRPRGAGPPITIAFMEKSATALLSLFILLVVGATACEVPDAPNSSQPTFGQPYKTTIDTHVGPPIPLIITVSAPKRFEPSSAKDAQHGDDVYFTVTIKNASKRATYTADVAPTDALSGLAADDPGGDEAGGHGKSGHLICDFQQDICGIDGSPQIKPGQSLTFKDGFSVQQVSGITYKIQPAGLAGDTLYFQQ